MRIALPVDLVLDAGGIQQEGQITLHDVAHLRTRDGVFAGGFGLPLRRIVTHAVEQRRQQVRVRAPGCRASILAGPRSPLPVVRVVVTPVHRRGV